MARLMAIPPDIANALHGAWRLARFDRSGLALFEHGEGAFWRSFRAALIAYPAFLVLLTLRLGDAEWQDADLLRIFLVETIGYVIAWVAFPLLMLPATRFLGRGHLWLDFIIIYNWSQILQYALFFFATGLAQSNILPEPLASGILSAATVAVLVYEWFIARVALDIAGPAAAMIVLLDLVLGALISRAAELLH
jgi:hypothetical protein